MSFNCVVEELLEFIETEPKDTYSIIVGSDSDQGASETTYISAIVLYRHGKGGRFFWHRENRANFKTLRERIWHETTSSTDLASKLTAEFQARGNGFRDVEVHVDIGERGPTRELIKEICGFVTGVGFEVHIKPESFAACAVADRIC